MLNSELSGGGNCLLSWVVLGSSAGSSCFVSPDLEKVELSAAAALESIPVWVLGVVFGCSGWPPSG